jgi:hypothetical protein
MRDADVRVAMLKQLCEVHRNDPDTRIVQEMGVWSGTVRIDIAVINGQLSGFELKSDRDTLLRLPSQCSLYSRLFDNMTLVVGSKHVDKALPLLPEWWGIITAVDEEGFVSLVEVRECSQNPDQDPFLMAQLLWREEALTLLDDNGLARGWRSKSAPAIHRYVSEVFTPTELSSAVRLILKKRVGWLGQPVTHMRNMAV